MSSSVVSATPRSKISSAAAATIRSLVLSPRRVSRRPSPVPVPFVATPETVAQTGLDNPILLCQGGSYNPVSHLEGKTDMTSTDLADAGSVRALARRAVELGGGHVDILVNNAGVFPFGPTQGASDADIDTVYAVNVKAPFILTGELAPAMAARGRGSVINVLTMVAHFGVAGMALYGSSKAALTLLTKAWAAEFGPSGVRVNAVSPGPTRTEGTEVMGDQLDQLAALAPAGRPGRDRFRHRLPGQRRGQLRPRRRPRRRRRPPRRLTARARWRRWLEVIGYLPGPGCAGG